MKARFSGLPTGLKMLFILSLGLLPLWLLAVLASIDNANENRMHAEMEAQALLATAAQRLAGALDRTAITLRFAADSLNDPAGGRVQCAEIIRRMNRVAGADIRFALYSQGELRCSSADYTAAPVPAGTAPVALEVMPDRTTLRLLLYNGARPIGVAWFDRDTLLRLAGENSAARADLLLTTPSGTLLLRDGYSPGALTREVGARQPLLGGAAMLQVRMAAAPLTFVQAATIALPVLMWLAAALMGWAIVDSLILRPLERMQRAVAAYRPGDQGLALPALRSPAREISALGRAFDQVTRTVHRHEADLEAAVERQTRLVREVHHRVKNNLQVVASLLNLHARGAKNDEVAAAYASIQRRVDALAVVHRNHYAELEDNRGVALKPLVSELASNLRGNAPRSAAHMQVRIDIQPFHVTQDTAVSVAFFVTEVMEFGMLCGARHVSVVVEGTSPGLAELAIESDSLVSPIECDPDLFSRFERIVTGLSRQLRSTLDHDGERGRYAVRIQTLERADNDD